MSARVARSNSGIFALMVLAALIVGCPECGAAPAPANLADRIELRLEKGERVQKLCLSPDNRYLAAAINDAEGGTAVYKWDLRTKQRLRLVRFSDHNPVVGMAWPRSAEGIVVRKESWVGWYDPRSGALRAELHTNGSLCYEEREGKRIVKRVKSDEGGSFPLPFAGNKVLMQADGGQLRLTHLDHKERGADCLFELPRRVKDHGHGQYAHLRSLTVSADGSTAALAEIALDPGSKVRVWAWNVKTGKLRCEVSYAPRNSAAGLAHLVAISRNGSYLVAAIPGMSPAFVLDAEKGKLLYTCPTEGVACRVAASPVADVFACLSGDEVELWKMREEKRLMTFTPDPDDPGDPTLGDEGYGDLQFSPDGTRLAWGNETIRIVRVPRLK